MHTVEAIKTLAEWDRYGWNVFTLSDMRKLFPHQSEKTLSESLRRLVRQGLLERVANGVFVNPLSSRSRVGLLERISCAIRRGEYNYISLECALSEWGVISQIPQSCLTVVTTGRKGVFSTPYGEIEFTHTQQSAAKILKNTVRRERPLRIATAPAALRDLRRVGRNLHLVDLEEMQEYHQDRRKGVVTKEGSFRKLAEIALEHHPELAGMEVIVEKELFHYELLHVLNRGGWLDGLTFQGGTALRLCYGGSRLSEELDFSGGPEFSSESMEGLAAYLKETLSSQGLGVDVKNPKTMTSHFTSGIGVNIWRIAFEILPFRSGIPKQMIKLDIDNSPTYTKVPRTVAENYGVVRESRMLVHVQSREEILASKFVAFAASVATRNRPRFRDIWDMHWLTGNGTAIRNDLVRAKMGDHRIESAWMETAASHAGGIVGSAEFAAEMRRFLLPHVAVQTLDNPLYMEFLASETERLIRTACR